MQNKVFEKIKERGENEVKQCEKKATRKAPRPFKTNKHCGMWKFVFE
jgi:hypothetical protein